MKISLKPFSSTDLGSISVTNDSVVDSYYYSAKGFMVHKDVLERIYTASEGFYRIHVRRNEVFEGEFDYSQASTMYAIPAFKRFYESIWK